MRYGGCARCGEMVTQPTSSLSGTAQTIQLKANKVSARVAPVQARQKPVV